MPGTRVPAVPGTRVSAVPGTRVPAVPGTSRALLSQPTARVRVHLDAPVPDTELYDVASTTRLCLAPCRIWPDVASGQQFQIAVPGLEPSRPFTMDELSGDAAVRFTPRVEGRYALGKALTITGIVVVGAAYVSAAAWLVVELLANLLVGLFGGRGWLGAFELLYFAAGAAIVGSPLLAAGIPTCAKARERLDIGPADATPFPDSRNSRSSLTNPQEP